MHIHTETSEKNLSLKSNAAFIVPFNLTKKCTVDENMMTHTHTHTYFLIKIEPSCVHAYVLCTIRYGVTGGSVWWVERVCCCAVQTHHFGQVLLNAARSYGGHGKKACACWGLDCFPSLTQPKTKPQIIIMTGQFHSQLEM